MPAAIIDIAAQYNNISFFCSTANLFGAAILLYCHNLAVFIPEFFPYFKNSVFNL